MVQVLADRIRKYPPFRVWEILFQLLGLLFLWLGAGLALPIPGSEVPISLQTLVVIVLGAWLGPVRAGLLLCLYLFLGAAGLPVFARGRAGLDVLLGPTGGFLLGFVLAAIFVGWEAKKRTFTFLQALALALLAHLIIFVTGYAFLAVANGYQAISVNGLLRLLPGLGLKSLLAGLLIAWSQRWLN